MTTAATVAPPENASDAGIAATRARLVPNNFDLIRLFAASEVAVKHSMLHLGLGGERLEAVSIFPGVPIFYFISGFLIFQSYQNSHSLRIFAANRFYRLYPGLFTCLAIGVLLALLVGALGWRDLLSPGFWLWVVAQSTFVQFYNPDFLRDFGVGSMNGSLWTISVELQFYVLTPVLAFLVARWRGVWLAGTVSVAANLLLAALPVEATSSKLLMVTFLPWIYMFMVGAWISSRPDLLDRVKRLPLAACLAIFACTITISIVFDLPYTGNGIGPVAFAGLILLVVKLAYSAPTLAEKLLRRNDISYGIYIYHMLAVNVAVELGYTGNWWALAAVLGGTVGTAILSWRLVERPALAAKRRTIHRV